MRGRVLAVGDLLGIDVGAEVDTLSTGQLQGPWQVPAELVRDAVRRGARSVAVRAERGSLEVRVEGAAPAREELDLLAETFDPGRAATDRHRAVVALERAGAIALVWAAGSGAARVEVATSAGGGRRVAWRPGQAPRSGRWVAPQPGQPTSLVRLQGGRLELGRATDWLRSSCRFAPVPVEVNRGRLEPRFPDGLLRARNERPLPGLLSVAATGEAPLLWLLQHGVVSTRATVPGYPAFQAAVELGGLVGGPVAPGVLREAVAPHLPELVDRVIAMLLRAAEGLDRLPPVTARRVVLLLLEAAAQGLRRGEVLSCRLLPAAGDGRGRWSLEEIRAAADRGTAPWALEPTLDPGRFAVGGRGTLQLGREERGLIRDLVGVGLESPPRRRRGWWSEAGRRLRATWAFLRTAAGTGGPVPEDRLSGAELRFAGALEGAVLDPDGNRIAVRFTSGAGRPRRLGRRLDLPRRNPEVAGWVRGLDEDPDRLYPVALAISGPDLAPAPEVRRRWLDRHGVGRGSSRLAPADQRAAPPVGEVE